MAMCDPAVRDELAVGSLHSLISISTFETRSVFKRGDLLGLSTTHHPQMLNNPCCLSRERCWHSLPLFC